MAKRQRRTATDRTGQLLWQRQERAPAAGVVRDGPSSRSGLNSSGDSGRLAGSRSSLGIPTHHRARSAHFIFDSNYLFMAWMRAALANCSDLARGIALDSEDLRWLGASRSRFTELSGRPTGRGHSLALISFLLGSLTRLGRAELGTDLPFPQGSGFAEQGFAGARACRTK